MEGFEFKIGELVCMKTSVEKSYTLAPVFMVVERIMQECPGGVQRHYVLRLLSTMGGDCKTTTVEVLDIEVCKQPVQDYSLESVKLYSSKLMHALNEIDQVISKMPKMD